MPRSPITIANSRVRRWARGLEPALARRMLAAWDSVRLVMPVGEIERLLAQGASPERIVSVIAGDAFFDRVFAPVGSELSKGTISAAERLATLMPTVALREGVGSGVNLLNPRVIDGLAALNGRVLGRLKTGAREAFIEHMQAGLEQGQGTRSIARGLRSIVGLAPNQADAVRNFERLLREGDREALTRAWRDRRFDGTLRKALGRGGKGLSDKQINNMVAAYRRKAIASNAATQSRSAALDAYRTGQKLSWEDAFDKDLAERKLMTKTWWTVGDDRVREEHDELHGERVPFDEPFSNGEDIPGEASYSCRCGAEYKQVESVAEAQKFLLGRGALAA